MARQSSPDVGSFSGLLTMLLLVALICLTAVKPPGGQPKKHPAKDSCASDSADWTAEIEKKENGYACVFTHKAGKRKPKVFYY